MTSGLSGLQVRGAVRLFSFLKLYELRELKEMAIVAHVDQGPKQSMRKDGWIRPCPQATAIIDIILTKLKVKRQRLIRFTDISLDLALNSLMTKGDWIG